MLAGRITALATRSLVNTQVDSSWVAPRFPAIYGSATTAMDVSKMTMNVASITAIAISHGFALGRHSVCAPLLI